MLASSITFWSATMRLSEMSITSRGEVRVRPATTLSLERVKRFTPSMISVEALFTEWRMGMRAGLTLAAEA